MMVAGIDIRFKNCSINICLNACSVEKTPMDNNSSAL